MTKTFVQVSEQEIESRAKEENFPAPNYSANVLTDVFEDAKRLFLDYMIEVDYAHTVMLAEQGIITRVEALSLLVALDGLDRDSLRTSRYDGRCEDLFFYIESLITAACGEDVAGRLHTARSRNDIDVTIYRMRLREDALILIRAALNLRREMLNIVERHHESLMPAYTHTQPAQPTTLSHYMLAMAEVFGREFSWAHSSSISRVPPPPRLPLLGGTPWKLFVLQPWWNALPTESGQWTGPGTCSGLCYWPRC